MRLIPPREFFESYLIRVLTILLSSKLLDTRKSSIDYSLEDQHEQHSGHERGFDRDKEILQGFYGAINALTLGPKGASTIIGWCERPMSIPIPPSCWWA